MKSVGKPDAGNPHVRFDERGRETELRQTRSNHRALPRLYSHDNRARQPPRAIVGGKKSNRHKDKRGPHVGPGTGPTSDKAVVVGAVKRKRNVVARVIENTKAETLTNFVSEAVSNKVSLICTDEWKGYARLKKNFNHGTVDHSKEQYVGAIHTQTIEGFWSLIKRGTFGTYHKVSKKYF